MSVRFFVACAALFAVACARAPSETIATVRPVRETPPIGLEGDAADDPAIWVGAAPGEGRVIATQKKGGYFVYDLDGRLMQKVLLGLPNNVDLTVNFPWPDGPAPLVVASDRADNSIPLFRFDPTTAQLESAPRARIASGFAEVYGICAGRRGDDTLVVATSKTGDVGVWLVEVDQGAVTAARIASFALGSIAEGCVVDGAANAFYVSQELRGLWRIGLDDATGANRTLVDTVAPEGHLVADVEGVSIWEGQDGGGYLVVSVQGESRFAVYDRAGAHTYRGSFRIAAAPAADGVSGTDGIALSSAPLGASYPKGLLVAQDDENTAPAATQNFKYVSWSDVENALKLGQ